jgi:hypothetical protein
MSSPSTRFVRSVLLFVSVLGVSAIFLQAQGPQAPPSDALTRLEGQLERRETTLDYREGTAICPVFSSI